MVFSADTEENTSNQLVASSPTRHYHAADGKLRAVKKFGWSTGPSGVKRNDLVQEIRYDALGRRIFQHTRRKPLCENPCYEAFERYVWDGDQLLYELRSSSGSSQYSSGKQYGRTGYVHGPGIDAPLAIMRKDFQSSAAIRINPFANWRGQYERGNASGGWPLCTGSNGPNCISVAWPAPQARTFLDGVPAEAGDWVGSLIKDQRDASGLLYRRNRYYDPYTGQFTQEDPIGVAGGFNLYGFAGGDPISYTDPFGLDPCLTGPGWYDCIRQAGLAAMASLAEGVSHIGAGLREAALAVLPIPGTRIRSARTLARVGAKLDNLLPVTNRAHLSGAAAELRGAATGFDHVTEVRNAMNGLRTQIHTLNGVLGNPNLNEADRLLAEQMLGRASRALDAAESVFTRAN